MSYTDSCYFKITNDGAYIVRFFVEYYLNGGYYCLNSYDFNIGQTKQILIPCEAYNIRLIVQYCSGTEYFNLFERIYPVPIKQCFITKGLIFSPSISPMDCP